MGKLRRIRIHTPSGIIDVDPDRVLNVGFTTSGCSLVSWRDPETRATVQLLGGAIEIHEDESPILVPTLSVVPGNPKPGSVG